MSLFKKAERKRVKLKIAITGPSGSGKTYSALELATGLGKKIALIDTENDSASLYSDRFEFDSLVIDPPYTITKYTEAVKAALADGYEVLVIDSISHAWAGDGGLLSKKEAMDARGGNNFANWGTITKEQETFKSALLNADIHMICTMRSKQEYAQIGEGGKLKVQKLGLAPIQRDGMEYEFTTVFDVAMDHKAAVSKDRTGLFGDRIETLSQKTGEELLAWLGGATAEPRQPAKQEQEEPVAEKSKRGPLITEPQRKRLYAIASKSGVPDADMKLLLAEYGIESSKDIPWVKYDEIVRRVEKWGEAPASQVKS
jgi:hypothetical protein